MAVIDKLDHADVAEADSKDLGQQKGPDCGRLILDEVEFSNTSHLVYCRSELTLLQTHC